MTPPRASRPILVTGCPRSGTTWTGKVLAEARECFYVYEPLNPDAPHHVSVAERFAEVTEDGPAELQAALADICRLGDGGVRVARAVRGLMEAGRDDYDLAGRLAAAAVAGGRRFALPDRVLIKDPLALHAAHWLAEAHEAMVVILVRDPVGVVSSYLNLGWRSEIETLLRRPVPPGEGALAEAVARRRAEGEGDEVGDLVLQWRLLTATSLQLARAVEDAVLVIHDRLCAAPEAHVAALFDWLGLDHTKEVRRLVEKQTTGRRGASSRPVQHDHHRDAKALPHAARDRIAPEIAARVEAEAAPEWSRALQAGLVADAPAMLRGAAQ